MGFLGRFGMRMDMLVMFVVNVRVGMHHAFMLVLVLVPLGQMQPSSSRHQQSRCNELQSYRLSESKNGTRCSDERGR
jgi:hypothetical protein